MVGQTVSHYRIVEKIGGGGMGVVYKAVDVRLNRFVALKFLPPGLTTDPEANARFMDEAQAASALDHPNICTIHEIDETPTHELFLTMAYYDGETLSKRLERGPLSIDDALEIAVQIAQALACAHESGIVHRDVKPANLMIAKDGLVKILDFGLAKLAGHTDLTRTGTTVGTIAYMSPEQILGTDIGPRVDVWAVGVVLYEMLAGRGPFDGKDALAVLSSIANDTPRPLSTLRADVPLPLRRILSRAIDRNLQSRYTSAVELLADLVACRAALTESVRRGVDVWRILRRPAVAIPLLLVLIVPGVWTTVAYQRGAKARWARDVGIPQIMQLVAKDDHAGAFAVATQVEQQVPNDPVLATLWPQVSAVGMLVTDPPDADAYVQPYSGAADHWEYLGRTPLQNLRLPRGAFRFRIEKAGFEPQFLATTNPGFLFGNGISAALNTRRLSTEPVTIALRPKGDSSEMAWVAGGTLTVGLTGFNSDRTVSVEAFLVDRNEVTNADFKRFVDRGGYETREYWRELPSPDLAAQFRDSTTRPGPSTWELGEYASGQAEYPVGGVSWYEAVAYCRSIGKTLPSLFHWARAAVSPFELGGPLVPLITPLSNFSGKVAAVATYRGLGPYGTYDMAGNVREWVWNEAEDSRRWILGGTSNDPEHMFVVPISAPAFDRSDKNGFRCVKYAQDQQVSEQLLARVDQESTDPRTRKPVSNEVFDVFKRQYAYVTSPLNDRVESSVGGEDWVREKITFDAGYEKERAAAYLFLPKNAAPPYQLVVLFPGLTTFIGRGTSADLQPGGDVDFIVKSGRAVVWPIYKGSFERWDALLSLQGDEYLRAARTRMFHWRQDVGRVLDILTARPDIDDQRLAYLGVSFGASTAFPLVALEERFKVVALRTFGFTYRVTPAEADAINYVSRVTIPVLMIGGLHDYVFPYESAQKPMFERLGTPAEHKKLVSFEAGHGNFPRSRVIREVLEWLDRYLGPVTTARASG